MIVSSIKKQCDTTNANQQQELNFTSTSSPTQSTDFSQQSQRLDSRRRPQSTRSTTKESSLKEFQEFLRRVCTLQMSASTSGAAGNDGKNIERVGSNKISGGSFRSSIWSPHSAPTVQFSNENNETSANITSTESLVPTENKATEDLKFVEVGIDPTFFMDNNQMDFETSSSSSNGNQVPLNQNIEDQKQQMTNIRVTVGIDKDLEMILEMDPSIVDLGDVPAIEQPRAIGLPPLTGG